MSRRVCRPAAERLYARAGSARVSKRPTSTSACDAPAREAGQ